MPEGPELARLRALSEPEGEPRRGSRDASRPQEPLPVRRALPPLRPVPRAPSLSISRTARPVPRAPSLDMEEEASTPIPGAPRRYDSISELPLPSRPPPREPPPPPRTPSMRTLSESPVAGTPLSPPSMRAYRDPPDAADAPAGGMDEFDFGVRDDAEQGREPMPSNGSPPSGGLAPAPPVPSDALRGPAERGSGDMLVSGEQRVASTVPPPDHDRRSGIQLSPWMLLFLVVTLLAVGAGIGLLLAGRV